jgi:peptide/nickel transport system ATP-binding protein
MALLDVENFSLSLATARGRFDAVRDVSFSLERGQTLGIVGESGCGKSLTALSLMGLQPEGGATRGRIRLNGQDLLSLNENQWCQLRGNRLAMIFQEPMTALNPVHTIGQQIAEPLRLHQNLSREAARAKALELLHAVAMPQAESRLEAYPHQLSGGQRQRVGIAMALACSPDVLIADEPTTALDASVQRQILNLIGGLVRERGMGLVLISHDLALIAQHVQHVAVMYGGMVVETGPTTAVFAKPAHPYTRGLLAARPSLTGPRGQKLQTIAGTVPPLHALGAACAFAPRCALATSECSASMPALRAIGSAQVRCIHAGPA